MQHAADLVSDSLDKDPPQWQTMDDLTIIPECEGNLADEVDNPYARRTMSNAAMMDIASMRRSESVHMDKPSQQGRNLFRLQSTRSQTAHIECEETAKAISDLAIQKCGSIRYDGNLDPASETLRPVVDQ
jgi:hypothetical protein